MRRSVPRNGIFCFVPLTLFGRRGRELSTVIAARTAMITVNKATASSDTPSHWFRGTRCYFCCF